MLEEGAIIAKIWGKAGVGDRNAEHECVPRLDRGRDETPVTRKGEIPCHGESPGG
jgi:hypothetical protein